MYNKRTGRQKIQGSQPKKWTSTTKHTQNNFIRPLAPIYIYIYPVGFDLPPIWPNGLIGPCLAPWSGAPNPIWLVGPRRTALYKEVGAGGIVHELNSCHSSPPTSKPEKTLIRSRVRSKRREDSPTSDPGRPDVRTAIAVTVIADLLLQRRHGFEIDLRRPCSSYLRWWSNSINPDLFIRIYSFLLHLL